MKRDLLAISIALIGLSLIMVGIVNISQTQRIDELTERVKALESSQQLTDNEQG